jgi:hypothetical protein
MRQARTRYVPSGTPAIAKRPSSPVAAPSAVPITFTDAWAIGWCVVRSTTRPRIVPTAGGAADASAAASNSAPDARAAMSDDVRVRRAAGVSMCLSSCRNGELLRNSVNTMDT